MSATPIDEGIPVFSSYTPPGSFHQIDGSNFAGSMRAYMRDDIDGSLLMFTYWMTSNNPYDQTLFRFDDTLTVGTLVLTNPIAYKAKAPSAILLDLIQHQAHADRMRFKAVPDGEGTPNNWTRDVGGAALAADIDDDVDTWTTADTSYITTTTAGTESRFTMDATPSNGDKYKEVIVRMWAFVSRGTDLGLGVEVKLYDGATQVGSTRIIDMYEGPVFSVRYGECKFEGLDRSITQLTVSVTSLRGFVGGTPNPAWRIYAMDAICFITTTDINAVDAASFSGLDSYFTSQSPAYNLDGDFYDMTFREGLMRVLRHAPELIMFLNYQGQLALKKIPEYSDTGSPFLIGRSHGNLRDITAMYLYDERYVTDLTALYDSAVAHRDSGTALPDPDLGVNFLTYLQRAPGAPISSVEVEREMILDNVSADIIISSVTNQLALWGPLKPLALEIRMSEEVTRIEIGDTVALDEPDIGFVEREFMVVSKGFDIDAEEGVVILYDKQFVS